MTTQQPARLTTARLLLRPFETHDVEDVFAYSKDPEFARYFPSIALPYEYSQSECFVIDAMAVDWDRRPTWAIERDHHVIGSINARFDQYAPRAEIAYGIARASWGQGLTTEAARAVVDWLFASFDLVRVMAQADARNIGSRRVMEHLGMQHEGTLRQHRNDRGTPVDDVIYGLLRSEWEAARQRSAAPLGL